MTRGSNQKRRSTNLEKRVIINQGLARTFLPGVFEKIHCSWVARLELIYRILPTQVTALGLEAFYNAAQEVCQRQGHEPVISSTIAIGAFTLDIYSRKPTGIPWLAIVAFLEEMRTMAANGLERTFSGELEPVMNNYLTGRTVWVRLRIMGSP